MSQYRTFTIAAIGRALGVTDPTIYNSLKGPNKVSLVGGGRNVGHFLPDIVAFGVIVMLGSRLKPHQRVVIVELVQKRQWRELLYQPRLKNLFLEVPLNGLDPQFRDDAPPWDRVALDLGRFACGLRDAIERIAAENPAWALRHVRPAGAGFVPDMTKKTDSKKSAELSVPASLRAMVQEND